MHLPGVALLLGDAGLAGIEPVEGLLDGLAHGALGAWIHVGPVLPGGVDGGGEIGHGLIRSGRKGFSPRLSVLDPGLSSWRQAPGREPMPERAGVQSPRR